MVDTVVKSIGTTSRDYSTITAWAAALPSNFTTSRSSTCGSGSTSSTIVLDASASGSNDFYKAHTVVWNGQTRLITAYTGATKTATIGAYNGGSATWSGGPPASGDAYSINAVIWQGECYNDSTFTDDNVTISGHTTSSAAYPVLTTGSGQSFVDNANKLTNALKYNASNGVSWSKNFSYSLAMTCGDSYFQMSNLQIKDTGGTNAGLLNFSASSNCVIQNCIFEQPTRNGYQILKLYAGVTRNCLFVYTGSGASSSLIYLQGGAAMSCCTVVQPSDLSTARAYLTSVYNTAGDVIDSAFFGMSNTFFGTFGSGSGYNCTDLSSAPGSNNQTSKTYSSQFQGVTSSAQDYRLKTGADCLDTGTTDTTNNPSAIDIVGTTRPQGSAWDIGAWELVVAAARAFFIRQGVG